MGLRWSRLGQICECLNGPIEFHAETLEEMSVEESDVGVVLDLAVGQRGTPTPRMLKTHAPIYTSRLKVRWIS
ncbi:hypothetical protein D6C84_07523 [Aureobasidium pullulans]|uniref:Uncharacterized protein n=1 Tax=Aureobasidium pullulans TaxID=5580 RepID=A0A4S9XKW9_AURPU|nr:hypothetical protein D6C84_07523 [Aureobasidium pullulans]